MCNSSLPSPTLVGVLLFEDGTFQDLFSDPWLNTVRQQPIRDGEQRSQV